MSKADKADLMVKLPPRLTGLPMVLWVPERDGFRHDVRVKVSRTDRRRGSRSNTASVGVRPGAAPRCRAIASGRFPIGRRLVQLNRDAITDYWDGED